MVIVLGGVLAGIIVLILARIWHNGIPQILQKILYQEPYIQGEWNTLFQEDGNEFCEVVTLKQRGRWVKGQIALKVDKKKDVMYTFKGTFKHLMLTCMCWSADRTEYQQGVFALRYKDHCFTGQYVVLSKLSTEQFISSPYKWNPPR